MDSSINNWSTKRQVERELRWKVNRCRNRSLVRNEWILMLDRHSLVLVFAFHFSSYDRWLLLPFVLSVESHLVRPLEPFILLLFRFFSFYILIDWWWIWETRKKNNHLNLNSFVLRFSLSLSSRSSIGAHRIILFPMVWGTTIWY